MSELTELLRSKPTQARSREALERFIEAGEQSLADNTFEQIGVSALAKLAKSSVGTFYRLFDDKEVLFRLLYDRFVQETKQLITDTLDEERLAGVSAAGVLSALIEALASLYCNREGLLRALIIRSSSDVGFRAGLHSLNKLMADKLTPLLDARKTEIGHPNSDEAISFALSVVLGTMNHQSLAGQSFMSNTHIVTELEELVFSYLRIDR